MALAASAAARRLPGRRLLLAAGLAAACLLGSGPLAAADEAQDAYRAGNFAAARKLWTPLADAGDPAAQLGLGTLFDFGEGVPRDRARAARLYRRAAEAGLSEAEFDLAVIYDSGDGVPRDAARAALWYGRAAAHGDHRAQYDLGLLYTAGDGVPRNPAVAAAWFRAAAVALPAARQKLAVMRPVTKAAAAVSAAPLPASVVAPRDGDTIVMRRGRAAVELVWTAQAQAARVRFFVQLLALSPKGPPREVFASYVGSTAALAPVADPGAQYAWRVYAVSASGGRYAASRWALFRLLQAP